MGRHTIHRPQPQCKASPAKKHFMDCGVGVGHVPRRSCAERRYPALPRIWEWHGMPDPGVEAAHRCVAGHDHLQLKCARTKNVQAELGTTPTLDPPAAQGVAARRKPRTERRLGNCVRLIGQEGFPALAHDNSELSFPNGRSPPILSVHDAPL